MGTTGAEDKSHDGMTEMSEKNSINEPTSSSRRHFSVDDVYLFVDKHLRVIRYCFYGAGAIGLFMVARSLHVHKRFGAISDIPKDFIQKNIPFRARVEKLDNNNSLHVEHIPIMVSRWLPSKPGTSFAVSLAGVTLNPKGASWLSKEVLHKVVSVAPIEVKEDKLLSIVYLEKGILRRSICVNKRLVEQGICKMDYPRTMPSSTAYLQLLDTLIASESKADKKGLGLWTDKTKKQTRTSLLWTWIKSKFRKQKS